MTAQHAIVAQMTADGIEGYGKTNGTTFVVPLFHPLPKSAASGDHLIIESRDGCTFLATLDDYDEGGDRLCPLVTFHLL